MSVKKTEYTLLPTQYKFLFDMPDNLDNYQDKKGEQSIYNDISLYQGGFGSGKTFCGSLRGLLYALQWPGCNGLVTAVTQDLLDGTTKAKYIEHLENIGLKEGVHWWFENRKQTMIFLNGSKITFKTGSDPQGFRSFEYTWIELEEASLLTEELFKELVGRLRGQKRDGWKNYHRALFCHTNPGGKRGWLYRLFINPKTRKDGYRYVIAGTDENTFLGTEYVDMMLSLYSEEQAQELVKGKDVDYDNTVAFPQFMEDNIIDEIKFDQSRPLILSCDFNYNPMCWYLMQEKNGVWYIIKELIRQNVTTKEMCQLIQPTLDETGIRKLIIMGDAHGRDKKTNGSDYGVMLSYFADKMFDVNLRVQKSNPLIRERLSLVRGLIRNAKGEKRVFVDSSCKKLLYNFEEARNNLSNGGLHIPTDGEVQSNPEMLYLIHPIDAVTYPMFYLNRLRQMSGEDIDLT